MVAILFKIGMNIEDPEIIPQMLQPLEKRPQYDMASDTGLILYDCAYETVQFPTLFDEAESAISLGKVYETLLIKLEVAKTVYNLFSHTKIPNKPCKKLKLHK